MSIEFSGVILNFIIPPTRVGRVMVDTLLTHYQHMCPTVSLRTLTSVTSN